LEYQKKSKMGCCLGSSTKDNVDEQKPLLNDATEISQPFSITKQIERNVAVQNDVQNGHEPGMPAFVAVNSEEHEVEPSFLSQIPTLTVEGTENDIVVMDLTSPTENDSIFGESDARSDITDQEAHELLKELTNLEPADHRRDSEVPALFDLKDELRSYLNAGTKPPRNLITRMNALIVEHPVSPTGTHRSLQQPLTNPPQQINGELAGGGAPAPAQQQTRRYRRHEDAPIPEFSSAATNADPSRFSAFSAKSELL